MNDNNFVTLRKVFQNKVSESSIIPHCKLVEVSRSSFYYKTLGEGELNLDLMRLIDEEYLLHPWLGVPRMATWCVERETRLPAAPWVIQRG